MSDSNKLVPQIDSTTYDYVKRFGLLMEYKLSLNRHKGDREGWLATDMEVLMDRLFEEMDELFAAVEANAPTPEVEQEAADVANFAMMIADKYRK